MTNRFYNPWILAAIVLAAIVVGSCAPAVPYDQMPGYDPARAGSGRGEDLYSDAQQNRELAAEAIRQAELAEAAMTATAQAPIVHITETAAAMAIQGTQAAGTGTAMVQTQVGAMTATAIWWTPTPNFSGTQTAAAINADNTAIANAMIRDQLELQRQIQNNEWNRLAGPLATIAGVALALVLVMTYLRRQRYQPAPVDARGNIIPIIDILEGTATDLDRNPNYRGSVSAQLLIRVLAHIIEKRWGISPLLPEVTASRQDAVTERDQMIDLATRGLPMPSPESKEIKRQAGQDMVKKMSTENLGHRFKVLDEADDQLGVVDGTIIQVLDQDWKEAVKP